MAASGYRFTVLRDRPDRDRTMGRWLLGDRVWFHTIEPGESDLDFPRIGPGLYRARPWEWRSGSAARFPRTWVLEGPRVSFTKRAGFRWPILVHWGNFDEETKGCIVIGMRRGMLRGEPVVLESVRAVNRLREIVGPRDFEIEIKEAA